MRTRNMWIAAVAFAATAFGAAACDTTYEFDDVVIGGDDSAKQPRNKSNAQFLRSVYADLIGRTPELYDFTLSLDGTPAFTIPIDESQFLLGALDGVGDPTPMRNIIVAGLVQSDEIDIPSKSEVDDPAQFITDQFRKFLGRDPGEYELRAFLDEWDGDADVNPKTIIRALIASREYQSF